jgi:hypothetical protein
VSVPADPTKPREGTTTYEFVDWFDGTSSLAEGTTSIVVEETVTYTARYTPVENVARIGDDYYPTLQAAIDAAHEKTGNVTVTLLADISGIATIQQKAGLNLTVDGDGHTLAGQLLLDGGGFYGDDTLTIQNISFVYDSSVMQSGADAFVYVLTSGTLGRLSDTHNVTVRNCSFDGGEGNTSFVAVKATSGTQNKNFVLENLTATNLHSLAQLNAVNGVTITGCKATAVKNGINVVAIAGLSRSPITKWRRRGMRFGCRTARMPRLPWPPCPATPSPSAILQPATA